MLSTPAVQFLCAFPIHAAGYTGDAAHWQIEGVGRDVRVRLWRRTGAGHQVVDG